MVDLWGYKGSWFTTSQGITLEVWATETRLETSSDTTSSDVHLVSWWYGANSEVNKSFLVPFFFRSPLVLALLVLYGHEKRPISFFHSLLQF